VIVTVLNVVKGTKRNWLSLGKRLGMAASRVEEVKILLEVNKLINKTAGVDPAVSFGLTEVYNILSSRYGIDISKTSPKRLYGKSYSNLTQSERAEYTQIKRSIQRGFLDEN
jgi:hypothetical protein